MPSNISNLGLLEETEMEQVEVIYKIFFIFLRDEIFMTKETKLLKNRAVNCG